MVKDSLIKKINKGYWNKKMKEKVLDVLKGARVDGIRFYLCFLVTSFGKLSKIEAVFHIFDVLFKCNKLNTFLFSKSNS